MSNKNKKQTNKSKYKFKTIIILIVIVLSVFSLGIGVIQTNNTTQTNTDINNTNSNPNLIPTHIPTQTQTPISIEPSIPNTDSDYSNGVGITVEDNVIIGNELPMWGTICTKTGVFGNPYGLSKSLYILPVGEVVRLHELSKDGSGWVSIKAANWIPMTALCDW